MSTGQLGLTGTADHRRDVRHVTVLIIGKVVGPRAEYACVVRNISRRGLKARFPFAPNVGERLTFTLRGVPAMPATVRWAKGNQGGVEFDQPLDLGTVLAVYGSARMPRTPRFGCNRTTRLSLEGKDYAVELLDVSLGGAKLRLLTASTSLFGRVGTLTLPLIDDRRVGTVRWDDGERMGLQFATPLRIETLAQILSSKGCPS